MVGDQGDDGIIVDIIWGSRRTTFSVNSLSGVMLGSSDADETQGSVNKY